MDLSTDLWYSFNMKIILRNFAIAKIIVFELFKQWTMLIVFPFLY